ncbi:MAG: polysaccharide biosynthesis/export family protein [Fuerstia sp.]|nr:polysaccharide biosynthesis/export family protein [Fuerstiella sp.]
MSKSLIVTDVQRRTRISGTAGVAMPFVALAMVSSFLTGCNTISSIPVSRVPGEILAVDRKDDFVDISMLRLRQDPPPVYLLGPGDVLGVFIKGVLGNEEELPPVHFPEDSNRPPAIGYPVPVREDGTLALPIVDPIKVEGMSLVEATTAVRNAYTYPRTIIKEGEEQIIVTLIRQRKTRVQVIREEGGGLNGVSKRGTGHVVDLPAYENDLLHALTETGGMPGTDAKNEVLIYRGMYDEGMSADVILDDLCHSQCQDQCVDPCFCDERPIPDPPYVTRIPLRYNPAFPPTFTQDDIILNEGDIVIIRSRDTETFITAGLLPGGEHPLPRDKDLDVIGAIALAGGQLGSSGTGVNAIGSGGGGFGGGGRQQACPASDVIIIRELPCGSSIAMRVDLNQALQDPSQRILIKPNDVVILRYKITEEIGNVLINMFQINYLLGSGRN